MTRKERIALLCILCAAFALRLVRLDQQSIWYDEGLSIYYARGSLIQVLRGVSQTDHPPLHPLLLHGWMALCGDSEFSVRALSVWWGVLAVALLYRLGARLGRSEALIAAVLLAVSPFAVWYAQETRPYTMALALILATVDQAWMLFEKKGGVRHGIAYVLLGAAALYTHFYNGPILLALNIVFVLWQLGRWNWARLARWIGLQLGTLALFAPWAPFVAAQLELNATYWHGAVGPQQIVRRTLIAFGAGNTLEGPWALGAAWTLALLALLGSLAMLRQRKNHRPLLLLWLWMVIPTLFQIALNSRRPKFAPRYLINVLPAFLLLASLGIASLFRLARRYAFKAGGWAAAVGLTVAVAVLGGATTRSLANYYFDPHFSRPDMRAVARYIEENAAPDDLIVLVGGHGAPAFTYYYRGPLPVLPLPDALLPTTRAPLDVHALETLDRALAGRERLWLVLWQATLADPTGLISDELEHTYPRLGVGQTFHDVALDVVPRSPLQADFDGQVRLEGYTLPSRTVDPGGTVYLYLYWRSLVEMHHDYKVFTQILSADGQIVAQDDQIAGAAEYPTSHWPPGSVVRDRFLLTVYPETPPGQYTLIAGLYKPDAHAPRLPVEGAEAR
jgi:mannosyltransferase